MSPQMPISSSHSHPSAAHSRPNPRRSGRQGGRRGGRLGKFLVVAMIFLFMPIFVFGATVAATGTVTVKVAEHGYDGFNFWLPVPALLFDVAVMAAPMLIPEEALAEMRHELQPYRSQIRAIAQALEDVPSGSVLVDVRDGNESVRITKDWRSFEITVESPDTDVQISIPARLVGRTLDILG